MAVCGLFALWGVYIMHNENQFKARVTLKTVLDEHSRVSSEAEMDWHTAYFFTPGHGEIK